MHRVPDQSLSFSDVNEVRSRLFRPLVCQLSSSPSLSLPLSLCLSSGVTGMILMWIPTRNPAGSAVSPPSGVRGSAPEIFEIFGFFHLGGPILANYRELFRCFVAEVFSEWKAGLQHVIVYYPVLCVFGWDATKTLPHVSCPQIRCPLASIPAVYFYSTSTLQLLNKVRTLVFFDVDKGVALSHH